MGMLSDICGFFKALGEYLGDLLDPYPKKKGPSIHKSDESSPWRADSYEPLSLLSEEDQEEALLRGDKSLEDFTMSHVWPPEKQEDNNIVEVEQENEHEQNGDSENAESGENLEDSDGLSELESTTESDSGAFETDAFESGFDSDSDGSGSSGSYDGYIG